VILNDFLLIKRKKTNRKPSPDTGKVAAELTKGASWSRYKILAKKRRLSETNVLIVLAFYPFRDSTAIPKVHAVFEFALTAATKKIVAVSPL